MKSFNVINWDPNRKVFEPYDVIPYLVDMYYKVCEDHQKYPKNKYFKVPNTFEEFKEFVQKESQYQFWGRCEYEIILSDWPGQQKEEKVDIYWQIMMNIDLITEIVMNTCK